MRGKRGENREVIDVIRWSKKQKALTELLPLRKVAVGWVGLGVLTFLVVFSFLCYRHSRLSKSII